jgi:tetratricopeptide (TPR) repeat protein
MAGDSGSGRSCTACGRPLSRYNPDERCQACVRAETPEQHPYESRSASALPVSELFTEPQEIGQAREKIHVKTPNWILRRIREGERNETRSEFAKAMARTAREMGESVEPSERYVARLEDGDVRYPHAAYRRVLVALCGRPITELGFNRPQTSQNAPSEDGSFHLESYRSADIATQVALPQTGLFRLVPVGNSALYDADAAAMLAFRAADLQVGGGHLYASVIRYLHSDVAPRLFGSDGESADNRVVFTAAGALTEMAGWMAHDAGSDATAKLHFERALALVEVGGDQQLSAHILGSMSHLANHLNQPDEAIERARQGQAVLNSCPPNPDLIARLLALEARGFAAKEVKDSAICGQLLLRAEKALETFPAEPISPWVSHFDEGSLASEAARCMRQLGDLTEARRQAERIIELRPGNRTRSRALGQLILATVLIRQGKPDEACVVAQEVINSTQSLGSYLVIRQLIDLKPLLEPYRSIVAVADFLGFLDDALSQRQWLYQWLTRGAS